MTLFPRSWFHTEPHHKSVLQQVIALVILNQKCWKEIFLWVCPLQGVAYLLVALLSLASLRPTACGVCSPNQPIRESRDTLSHVLLMHNSKSNARAHCAAISVTEISLFQASNTASLDKRHVLTGSLRARIVTRSPSRNALSPEYHPSEGTIQRPMK